MHGRCRKCSEGNNATDHGLPKGASAGYARREREQLEDEIMELGKVLSKTTPKKVLGVSEHYARRQFFHAIKQEIPHISCFLFPV
jgi:hypothetical protein